MTVHRFPEPRLAQLDSGKRHHAVGESSVVETQHDSRAVPRCADIYCLRYRPAAHPENDGATTSPMRLYRVTRSAGRL